MIEMQMIGNKLLKELSPLIDAPLMISDHNGLIIAATDRSRINTFHEGVPAVIRDRVPMYLSTTQARHILGAREEILTPVLIDDIPLAVLSIEGSLLQVEPYVKMLMKVAEMLIERALVSEDYDPEMQLLELFLTDLVDGQLTQELIERQLATLGLENNYERLAIIQLDRKTESFIIRHLIHTQMIHPNLIVARWNVNQVILLIPKVSRTHLQETLQLIWGRLEKLTETQVRMGIGGKKPLKLLAQSYKEANRALALCTRERALVFEEDLTLELFLAESTKQHQEEYINRVLGPIMQEPELLMNLEMWMNNNQSLTEVAAQLHIHKNTLKYRMKKIEQLLNVNLQSIKDQSALYIALFVLNSHYITK